MEYKEGKIIKGIVTGIESYGIFVSFDNFYSGLIHISEISDEYVKNINEVAKIGDNIFVKIIGIDEKCNHLSLSIKGVNYKRISFHPKKKIKETSLGFNTLAYKLPFWVEKKCKSDENNNNSIDKYLYK